MTTPPSTAPATPPTPHPAWVRLEAAFQQVREGRLTAGQFSDACRTETEWLATLPPRFPEVLHQLLDRLESSALFSEESCSFSQRDLFDSLQMWLDKARASPGGAHR